MQSRLKVRRRVVSCARCRRRKLSCDGKVPSCSRCLLALVPCVGFNSSTQATAPRSIAQFLETYIAREDSSIKHSQRETAVPDDRGAPGPGTSTFAGSLINDILGDITSASPGISENLPIARCVVAGTQIPSAKKTSGSTDLDENHPRFIINSQSETIGLESIPPSVATFLFDNYLTRVITQYPIYYTPDVVAAFNRVYYPSDTEESPSPRCVFTISIIMSISLSSAARNKQARANSIASKLFRNAMQHNFVVFTDDLQGMQALLLLAQYTFLNPAVANLWLLIGFVSQGVLDLGLHQELPISIAVSPFERDLRRRIFWCAYEMEVATSGGLLRPISLPREYCNVAFPSELDDEAITEAGIDPRGRVTKFTPRRIWMFRLIEAEIIAVLYQNKQVPQRYADLDSWMRVTDDAIMAWNSAVHQAAAMDTDIANEIRWKEMRLYADIAMPYLIVTLYRISPLVKEPSTEKLLRVFDAAVKVAAGYDQQQHADFGNTKYVFHPCHHSFSAAIAFLQALQRCKAQISEIYTLEQVESFMATFSNFFATIAERWPAATRCLEEYERLLAPVRQDYVDFLVQTSPMGEADRLLQLNFDEAVSFWNVFDSATGNAEYSWGLNSLLPNDWNAEFDFGMDLELFPGV